MILSEEEEKEINSVLKIIHDFNNGEDELVDEVIEIFVEVKKYTKNAYLNYLKFLFLEKFLDMQITFINNQIKTNEDYALVFSYCKDDLKFYFKTVKNLKIYIKKWQKSGDVDNLDVAFLVSIYLSDILENISEYFDEIAKIVGWLEGRFFYRPNSNIRENAILDIQEINKLMLLLEREER